jgi:hypothetical protein
MVSGYSPGEIGAVGPVRYVVSWYQRRYPYQEKDPGQQTATHQREEEALADLARKREDPLALHPYIELRVRITQP